MLKNHHKITTTTTIPPQITKKVTYQNSKMEEARIQVEGNSRTQAKMEKFQATKEKY